MMRLAALSCISVLLLVISACSSSSLTDPAIPNLPESNHPSVTGNRAAETSALGRSLLGFYTVIIDPETSQAEALPLRSASWHMNALKFMETQGPINPIKFSNIVITVRKIDLDISVNHPFPGILYYPGFDVKGIVIGPGDRTDATNPTRIWAGGPEGLRLMNADGWTRWWNPTEFPSNGTVFSYRDGAMGVPASGADYSATLSGYKIFANQLDKDNPIYYLLEKSLDDVRGRAVFKSGTVATRHYELVFPPDDQGNIDFRFNYAVDASHAFPDGYVLGEYIEVPGGFPPDANQLEPYIIDTNIPHNSVYISNDGCIGGALELKIRVSDWQALLLGQPVSEHVGGIELTSPTLFIGKRVPMLTQDSTQNEPWATYEIRLEGLTPDAIKDQQILVTVVSSEGDYQTHVSSYNGTEPLASYFVVRVSVTQVISGGDESFTLNPLSPWPKPGGDCYNRYLSKVPGPDNPDIQWVINNLWFDTEPVIGPENRIFVSERLPGGGVKLIMLNSQGEYLDELLLPMHNPQGNPVIVGCSLMWNDVEGNVVKIAQDGNNEIFYEADAGTGPAIFDSLNFNNQGHGFIYGPTGVNAFTNAGSEIWSVLGASLSPSVFVGVLTIASDGSTIVSKRDISGQDWRFEIWNLEPDGGERIWAHTPEIPNIGVYSISVDPVSSQIYYTLKDRIVAMNSDGEKIWGWTSDWSLRPNVALTPDGRVIMAETKSGNISLDGEVFHVKSFDASGLQSWSFEHNQAIKAGPVADSEGNVYFGDLQGRVGSIDPAGSLRWLVPTGGELLYLVPSPDHALLVGVREMDLETTLICLKD